MKFMILAYLIPAVAFLFLLFCIAVFASAFWANKSASPFWPTPEAVVRKALAEAGIKKDDVLYDLGAGTGSILLVADKEFGADAHGYEISLLFYLIGVVRIFLARSKAKMHFKSFFAADLSKPDFIFCFLLGTAIAKLQPQIEREAKSGAKLVSYQFRFHGWEPKKTVTLDDGKKIYVYQIPKAR